MSVVVRLRPVPSLGTVAFWWVHVGDFDAAGFAHAAGVETPLITHIVVEGFDIPAPPTMAQLRRHLPVIRARLAHAAEALERELRACRESMERWGLELTAPAARTGSFPRWRWSTPC